MDQQPYLSVIIPAYKEKDRIGDHLLSIEEYFRRKGFSYEIIVITDGSPDETAEVARSYADRVSNLRVIENPENHGKGYVVRQGLLEAKGKYRLFTDADGATSIDHLDTFLPQLEKEGYDVVIGSRDLKEANIEVQEPWYRVISGNMGNWAIQIVLGLWGFFDTQCGFKIVSDKAAEQVAGRMVIDRFGFDFEMLVLAKKLGFGIKQMPVRWVHEAEGSTVKLFGPNGYIQVLIDLAKTRWRLMTGQYRIGEYRKQVRSEKTGA
jgi:dolichyl-phosphate beta-glucosyltransferase